MSMVRDPSPAAPAVSAKNATMEAADATTGEGGEPSMKAAKSTKESSPSTSSAQPIVNPIWKQHVLEMIVVPSDGSCLFHALVKAASSQGHAYTEAKMRACIVQHLRRHADDYFPFWDGKEPTKDEKKCSDWSSYLELLAKPRHWGGALEIQAFAVKFGLPVVFYQHGLPIEVYNKGSWKENAPAAVALYFESGHYSWRRTNVQQLTCKIDLSNSFYYLFFSFVLLELKPYALKGKVLGEKL